MILATIMVAMPVSQKNTNQTMHDDYWNCFPSSEEG